MPLSQLAEYFAAERQGAWLLLALGPASFAFAWFLWSTRSSFMAMLWPLVLIGVLEVAMGAVVALRTPGQVATLEQELRTSAAKVMDAENLRMAKVNRNFRLVKVVEAVVIAAALLMILLLPLGGTLSSVGLGLLLQATVLLVFDAFAHQRALAYAQWLNRLAI
jgi:putative effector of murein hydrolase